MSFDGALDQDTEEQVTVNPPSSQTFSPSFNRHSSFLSPDLPSQKQHPPSRFFTPSLSRTCHPSTSQLSEFDVAASVQDSEAALGFDQDFDLHCRRIAHEGETTLTYSQLSELLVDMHLLNPHSSAHKPLLAQFWQVLTKPEIATIKRGDVKRALKVILGIIPEERAEWASFLRTFQPFTTNRLRYLNLQVHAITSALPNKAEFKHSKPQLPLGRSPTELLKSKPGLSPLRIPEARKLLATVKVNLTPEKFDVINVFRGDSVKELAERFIEKHGLAQTMVEKLRAMMEARLQSKPNSLD